MKLYQVRWTEKGEWKGPVVKSSAEIATHVEACSSVGEQYQVTYMGERSEGGDA